MTSGALSSCSSVRTRVPVRNRLNELTWLGFADEVESLTAARAGAMSGKEPSDALRVRDYHLICDLSTTHAPLLAQVVNALLTQLDKLKHRKNCLVMTTSNLSEAIGASYQPPSRYG